MTRRISALVAALLLLGGSLALPSGGSLALPSGATGQEGDKSEEAPAGSWKISLPTHTNSQGPAYLLFFEQESGKWSGKVVAAAARWPSATMENLKVEADQIRFDLKLKDNPKLVCTINLPKDRKTTKLRGLGTFSGDSLPLDMERTALAALTQIDLVKERLALQAEGVEAIELGLALLTGAAKYKATLKEVRAWSDKASRSAGQYGEAYKRDTLLNIASALADQKEFAKVAAGYAKQADRLLDPKKDSPIVQKRILDKLAKVLAAAGSEDEAKAVLVRLSKIDTRLKPKAFGGRKAKNERIVLGELFSSSQIQSCLAADKAYEALLRTYKTTEVVFIRYHGPSRVPDPLYCPESEARMDEYGKKVVDGLPTLVVNGEASPLGAGDEEQAEEAYTGFMELINPKLEEAEKAQLKLTAARKGDTVTVAVEVSKAAERGDDVRLRVVLVEKEVEFKGLSGMIRHRNVVRFMPGGDAGTVVKDKELKKTFTVDIAGLKKKLAGLVEKQDQTGIIGAKDRVPDLKDLRVIAFVQNDKNNAVLQAIGADVKGE